jgi:hypothetical protein
LILLSLGIIRSARVAAHDQVVTTLHRKPRCHSTELSLRGQDRDLGISLPELTRPGWTKHAPIRGHGCPRASGLVLRASAGQWSPRLSLVVSRKDWAVRGSDDCRWPLG